MEIDEWTVFQIKKFWTKIFFFLKCHLFEGINFELQIDYCLIVFLEKHFK